MCAVALVSAVMLALLLSIVGVRVSIVNERASIVRVRASIVGWDLRR